MANIEDSVPVSGCFAVVVPEETAQAGLALDLRRTRRGGAGWREWNDANWPVADSLVRADGIVERPEFLPAPPQERLVVDDPDNFPDSAAKRRTDTDQQRPLGGRGLNGPRQSGSEDSVLGFEVGDLAQQGGLGHVDQEGEYRVLAKSGHREVR